MPNDAQRATIRTLTQTHGHGSLGLQPRPIAGESKPSELETVHFDHGVTYLIDADGKAYRQFQAHALYADEGRHLYRVRDGRLERVSMLGQPGADRCRHTDWNAEPGTACPDCGILASQVLAKL